MGIVTVAFKSLNKIPNLNAQFCMVKKSKIVLSYIMLCLPFQHIITGRFNFVWFRWYINPTHPWDSYLQTSRARVKSFCTLFDISSQTYANIRPMFIQIVRNASVSSSSSSIYFPLTSIYIYMEEIEPKRRKKKRNRRDRR